MRTQTKTVLLLMSGFLVIILIMSGFIYVSISTYLVDDFYKLLRVRAYTFAVAKYEADAYSNLIDDISNGSDLDEKMLHESDYFLDVNSRLKTVSDSLKLPYAMIYRTLRDGEAEDKIKGVFYKYILYKSKKGQHIIVSSAESYQEERLRSYLQRTILFAIVSTVVLSFIFALYSSRTIFKPIVQIANRVKEISSENLHLRLETSKNNHELNELVQTFNDMLDRIETSFETQNNFVSNASHELRTPLTAIIGEADVCLSKLRRPEEYIETMQIILDEAEKLENKTKALLFLAQTGFSGKAQKLERVRIDQLLWDVKETIERMDSRNVIHIDMSLLPENPIKLKVLGNGQLLHLAFSNIISNACKYSDYRDVNISLGASDSHVFIIITDKGIGIPQRELKHIYDPFFRASNTKGYEGYGIGLPLTQTIIKMHKGNLNIQSILNRGTTVQIDLPSWSEGAKV